MATVLITGSNRGIGLALCREFKQRGDEVIATCRRSSPELDALGVEVLTEVDVASDESIAALARRLGTGAQRGIDVLVLNAGILRGDDLSRLDLASVSEQFAVNAVAPLRVAHALVPYLGAGAQGAKGKGAKGAKIALITSRMGSIADNSSGGSYGYRMSKAALNAMGVSLAHDLAGRGISVALLHPGYVRTDMTSHHGNVEPQDAARLLLARIDELTPATSGGFWHANGERLPW